MYGRSGDNNAPNLQSSVLVEADCLCVNDQWNFVAYCAPQEYWMIVACRRQRESMFQPVVKGSGRACAQAAATISTAIAYSTPASWQRSSE